MYVCMVRMYIRMVCMFVCMYVYTHPYTRKNRLISYNRQFPSSTFNPIRLKKEKKKIYIYIFKKEIKKQITIGYPTDLC